MYQPKKCFGTVFFLLFAALAFPYAPTYAEEKPGTISLVVEATLDHTEQGQQLVLEGMRLPEGEGVIGVRIYLNLEPTETSSEGKRRHVGSVYGYGPSDLYNFNLTLQQKVSGRVRITISPIVAFGYKGAPGKISVQSVKIEPVDNSVFGKEKN